MMKLIDTSLWVDFTRSRSSVSLKNFIVPYILDSESFLVEPVIFEIMRHAHEDEQQKLEAMTSTIPLFPLPPDLWGRAAALGRIVRAGGFTVGSMDLIIAVSALYHGAELITFDVDFQKIALVEKTLKINVLKRPV